MGSAFIIIGNDIAELGTYGNELKAVLIDNREKCIGQMQKYPGCSASNKESPKPVLLLDMGDNVGGGSPGDSAYLLKAIEDDLNYTSFHCIYDPEAVITASAHEPGEIFTLHFEIYILVNPGNHIKIK